MALIKSRLELLEQHLTIEGTAILLRICNQEDETLFTCSTQILRGLAEKGNSVRFGDWDLTGIVGSFVESGKPVLIVPLEGRSEVRRFAILERISPKINLLVFGAGHIGQCVASLGVGIGYKVVVVDDRPDFVSRLRFPDERIELRAGGFDETLRTLQISHNCAAVVVTRGHQYDEMCLRYLVGTQARYIGMIGSKRRVRAIFDRLIEAGVSLEQLSRVFAPIGLQISAKTPQEIGVAIIAQVIACLNGAVTISGK